jgi:hypothetical protein
MEKDFVLNIELNNKEFEEATHFISKDVRFKNLKFTTETSKANSDQGNISNSHNSSGSFQSRKSRWILVKCWLFEGLMLSNWLMDYFDTTCDGMALEEMSLEQRVQLGF